MSEEQIRKPYNPYEVPREVKELELGRLRPHPAQPRRFFGDEDLEELANDIRLRGIITPLLVVPTYEEEGELANMFYILSGERRWRAAHMLNLPTVPVLILDDNVSSAEHMVSANLAKPLQQYERYRAAVALIELVLRGYKVVMDQETLHTVIRYLHNPLSKKLKTHLVPQQVLQYYGSYRDEAEKLLKFHHQTLAELAKFLAAFDGLHPVVQGALESGDTYWAAAQRLSPWIKKMQRALPDHPATSDESMAHLVGEVGHLRLEVLVKRLEERRVKLLQRNNILPVPVRKAQVNRVLGRWRKRSSRVGDIDQRDRLLALLKEIEEKISEVENMFAAAGNDAWA